MKKYSILFLLLLCGVVFGLGQRVCVKKARNFAANQEYTVSQVENATKQQILTATGLTDPNEIAEYKRYWPGIKEMLLRDAIAREIAANEILVQSGLETLFPSVDPVIWEHPRVQEARYVLAVAARGDPDAL